LDEALVVAQPDVAAYQNGLAGSYHNLGLVLSDTCEADAARDAYEKAIARREALVATQPGVPDYQDDLARSYTNLANLLRAAGEVANARVAPEQRSITRAKRPLPNQDLPQRLSLVQHPPVHSRDKLVSVNKVHLQGQDAEEQISVGRVRTHRRASLFRLAIDFDHVPLA
jgi:hypothetical protein